MSERVAEERLIRRVEHAKSRIRHFLRNGTGNPPLGTLIRWLERQPEPIYGGPLRQEVISKAMAEMQSAKEVRVDSDRRVWLNTPDRTDPTATAAGDEGRG